MEILTKAVAAHGVKVLDDEGLVEALVSVTGNTDDGGDVIMPGAYAKTLKERTPKGVHGHSWRDAVARTEEAVELLPGDERLKSLLDNDTWLTFSQNGWGGLYVKGRYNLDTQAGREAYSNVKFYGADQEWSIGYSTSPGDTKKRKDGSREIHSLTLYEWSDVLFGMNSETVTAAVKSLQSKAFVVVSDSYEDIRRRIEEAALPWARSTFNPSAHAYVEATFDDRVILQVSWWDQGGDEWTPAFLQLPYTLTGDGVEFGDAVGVVIEGIVEPKTAEEAKARHLVLAQRTFGLDPETKAEVPTRTMPNTPLEVPVPSTDEPSTEEPEVEIVPNAPERIETEKGLRLDPLLAEWEHFKLTA